MSRLPLPSQINEARRIFRKDAPRTQEAYDACDVVDAAAGFVSDRWQDCPVCRDGMVEPPIDGVDPHGRYASAPCDHCEGVGVEPTAAAIEIVAVTWFNIEAGILPEDTEYGEELRWEDIDEIVRADYRTKARVVLMALYTMETT